MFIKFLAFNVEGSLNDGSSFSEGFFVKICLFDSFNLTNDIGETQFVGRIGRFYDDILF